MATIGQMQCMKDVVADKAIVIINEYRAGRYHGREVACILGNMFEAVNDTVESMMLLHPDKSNASECVHQEPKP